MLNTDNTCQPQCSAPNQTPVDGVCKECEEPCATCEGKTDFCTSCLNSFKLYLG